MCRCGGIPRMDIHKAWKEMAEEFVIQYIPYHDNGCPKKAAIAA